MFFSGFLSQWPNIFNWFYFGLTVDYSNIQMNAQRPPSRGKDYTRPLSYGAPRQEEPRQPAYNRGNSMTSDYPFDLSPRDVSPVLPSYSGLFVTMYLSSKIPLKFEGHENHNRAPSSCQKIKLTFVSLKLHQPARINWPIYLPQRYSRGPDQQNGRLYHSLDKRHLRRRCEEEHMRSNPSLVSGPCHLNWDLSL